ncbi:MAG TPA: DotI/IcmL/TraM family protein [Gammaproteobacteria bacterium]|nr:DotI/IcmL/TraM family protein [Gammaproteobacteria bacterium]
MLQKYGLSIIISLLVAHLGLMGFIYFQFATRSPEHFFGRLTNGETFEIIGLDRPNVSTKALLSWVTLAATSTFTFDFFNHKDQLNAMKDYFTADGFDSFIASLQETGVLTTIVEKKLILSAVAIGPAIVLTEERVGSKHNWRIQVPLIVRYQSANVDETRTQVVEVLVTQVSTEDAPKGIGIAQYIAREVGPELTR